MSDLVKMHEETYKGIFFSVGIAPYDKMDWGISAGKFMLSSPLPIQPEQNYETIEAAIKDIHKKITGWLETMPSDFDGWHELVESCMVWSGYEDCEIDKENLKIVMDKYAKWRGSF